MDKIWDGNPFEVGGRCVGDDIHKITTINLINFEEKTPLIIKLHNSLVLYVTVE